jgi:hypothetical protein
MMMSPLTVEGKPSDRSARWAGLTGSRTNPTKTSISPWKPKNFDLYD